MANATCFSVILLLMLTAVTGQTFQYSRGWTNGKRSDVSALGVGLPTEFKMNFPAQEILRQTNDLGATHCGLRQLKMLLQENSNDQMYLLPCDLLNILSKIIEEYHRSSSPLRRFNTNRINE